MPTLAEIDWIRIVHMTQCASEILSWELKLVLKDSGILSVLGTVAFKLRIC